MGNPLVVQIFNGDPSELSVQSQVTIPAGQASVEFGVYAEDDNLLDGSQFVTMTSQAAGYQAGMVDVLVTDSASLTLQVTAAAILERGGETSLSVSRSNTDNQSSLVVKLSISDSSQASIPASVIIPAGLSTAQFTILAINNANLDGLRTISILGTADGYLDASASIDIQDDERLFPWQNPPNPLGVNDSTRVTALDALLVINAINTRLILTPTLPDPFAPVAYVDVNGDGALTPLDALLVINYLNTHT